MCTPLYFNRVGGTHILMAKRMELLKEIRAFAKEAGLGVDETAGGNHT